MPVANLSPTRAEVVKSFESLTDGRPDAKLQKAADKSDPRDGCNGRRNEQAAIVGRTVAE